jgi:hypothetical protein
MQLESIPETYTQVFAGASFWVAQRFSAAT